jgi:DNA-binding Xre family transcriptional regulator
MLRFKKEAIDQLLEDRKEELNLTTYQHVRKIVEQGAEKLDPYALSNICRDLKCLPTDIIEYV